MDKFNIGDIVRLTSGGPAMTVSGLKDDKIVTTWWDEKHSEFGEARFPSATLTILEGIRDDRLYRLVG